MCLVLDKNNFISNVAADDIVCYKHLLISVFENRYHTPYYKFEVVLNKVYSSVISKKEYLDDEMIIEEGLHSFKTINDCEEDMFACFSNSTNEKRVIAKCIIPKGSTYYEGKFFFYDAYASSEIKYLEIIDVYDITSPNKY